MPNLVAAAAAPHTDLEVVPAANLLVEVGVLGSIPKTEVETLQGPQMVALAGRIGQLKVRRIPVPRAGAHNRLLDNNLVLPGTVLHPVESS